MVPDITNGVLRRTSDPCRPDADVARDPPLSGLASRHGTKDHRKNGSSACGAATLRLTQRVLASRMLKSALLITKQTRQPT